MLSAVEDFDPGAEGRKTPTTIVEDEVGTVPELMPTKSVASNTGDTGADQEQSTADSTAAYTPTAAEEVNNHDTHHGEDGDHGELTTESDNAEPSAQSAESSTLVTPSNTLGLTAPLHGQAVTNSEDQPTPPPRPSSGKRVRSQPPTAAPPRR
ncbi:hypothetical protein R1sor_001644 [Riccia sorocarpa]|uniref:Uncharacterized protein n=1 Tax=Riccia sorocarpa TaxID=122646 RepID=A0ABD3GZ11_9MARC